MIKVDGLNIKLKKQKKRFVNLCKKLYHIFRKQNKKDLQVPRSVGRPNRD